MYATSCTDLFLWGILIDWMDITPWFWNPGAAGLSSRGAGAWVHWAPGKGTNIVWQAFRISLVKHACVFHRCDKHCLAGAFCLSGLEAFFLVAGKKCLSGVCGVGNVCRVVSVHLASAWQGALSNYFSCHWRPAWSRLLMAEFGFVLLFLASFLAESMCQGGF